MNNGSGNWIVAICAKNIAIVILVGFLCWFFNNEWFVLVLCFLSNLDIKDN